MVVAVMGKQKMQKDLTETFFYIQTFIQFHFLDFCYDFVLSYIYDVLHTLSRYIIAFMKVGNVN